MREIVALMRASWLAAASYRLGLVISLVGFAIGFVPMFFVANAIQPIVADSISGESDRYFSFLVFGLMAQSIVTAAASTLPVAIAGSISSGTFEALLSTPVSVFRLVVGLCSYSVCWSLFRGALMVAGAALFGAHIFWGGIPLSILSMALLMASYFAIALVAAALILVFRTSGPLVTGVLMVSSLLGGVYYSTTAIPSWIQTLSQFVPLTYGLRAVRRVLLTGATLGDVWSDLAALALISLVLVVAAGVMFQLAMRHSRRAGTLAQY